MLQVVRESFDFKMTRAMAIKSLLFIGLALLITLVILFADEQIQAYANYGYWGIFLVSVAGNATLIFPAPSFAVAFAGGAVLNPVWVGIAAGTGAAIGELTGYLAGLGGQAVITDEAYAKLEPLVKKWGIFFIFGLAVIPNPFFDVAGIIAGTIRMAWWKFLTAAIAGKSLRFIGFGLIGYYFLA